MRNWTYSASVMCANLGRLEEDLQKLEAAGCQELHFDVMDGIFVPNFTLGFDIIRAARQSCNLPCNGHLMISKPEAYIERFAEAGCASITVHVETTRHPHRLLTQIRDAGASPGIALNPATPLTKLDYLLELADRVLIMAVNPGYAGQQLVPGAFDRVRILRENIAYRELRTRIEVDGNVTPRNAALFVRSGADILVLGTSSIFRPGVERAQALRDFHEAVAIEERRV